MCVHFESLDICRLALFRLFIVMATFGWLFSYHISGAYAEIGFSGMFLQGLDKRAAKALKMTVPRGVLVRDIALGSPANLGGVLRGDLIINYAGKNIVTFNDLIQAAGGTKPGQNISLVALRSGVRHQLKLVLEKKTCLVADKQKVCHNNTRRRANTCRYDG